MGEQRFGAGTGAGTGGGGGGHTLTQVGVHPLLPPFDPDLPSLPPRVSSHPIHTIHWVGAGGKIGAGTGGRIGAGTGGLTHVGMQPLLPLLDPDLPSLFGNGAGKGETSFTSALNPTLATTCRTALFCFASFSLLPKIGTATAGGIKNGRLGHPFASLPT